MGNDKKDRVCNAIAIMTAFAGIVLVVYLIRYLSVAFT